MSAGRVVIVLIIHKGIDKPYFDRNGVIWLKSGSDKRRVNSKEELRRLFQMSNQFHADGLPVQAGPETLDKLRFRDFLKTVYNLDIPDVPEDLRNLHKIQAGRGVNAPGVPEIPPLVFEELLVNALVHRDSRW